MKAGKVRLFERLDRPVATRNPAASRSSRSTGHPLSRLALPAVLALFFLLAACSRAPAPQTGPGAGTAEPSPGPGETATGDAAEGNGDAAPGDSGGEGEGGPLTLRIWLPPRFAPYAESEAGALLKDRLDAFTLLHPGIRITVRIKSEQGPGGMVASLDATRASVPEALPDLVLISRREMERAAEGGLLLPYSESLDPDWYDFARRLAVVDQDIIGLPFALDALVLLYRPEAIPDPPRDWTTTLNAASPLLFAGGSADGYFTLALYQAAGGSLVDPGGRPHLDQQTLGAVFEFFSRGAEGGVFPEAVLTISTEEEVYAAYQAGAADMSVVWVSSFFTNLDAATAASGLPTVTSIPYTLVNGWLWSLSNPDEGRRALAAELAQFLTAPDFLASWTLAAGMLPSRASALAAWPDSSRASLASRIVLSAHPQPPLAVLDRAGPALQSALSGLMAGNLTPQEAAEQAAQRVNAGR